MYSVIIIKYGHIITLSNQLMVTMTFAISESVRRMSKLFYIEIVIQKFRKSQNINTE